MRRAKSWGWPWLLCGLVALPLGGCTIIADVFSSDLASQLGLDPATIKPSQGVVIVSFKNATSHAATFFAFAAQESTNLSAGRNFSRPVAAGEVGNEVLDCPVGVIIPGSVGSANAINSSTVIVQTSSALETVTYGGDPLLVNQTYTCGDVVELGLYSTTASTGTDTTATETFFLTVRVIPGQ